MANFLYVIVKMIAVIHDMIMTWNDSFETVFSDKELHFLVIGFLGMGMLFVIYPLFKLLSENHVLVIAWIYVFTVIIVIVFAIEIGQGITGTGTMDFDDIVAGVAGFMAMFIAFVVVRAVVLGIFRLIRSLFDGGSGRSKGRRRRNDYDDYDDYDY
ncbi:hypothetical protein FMM74_007980 [Lachnospiraceae bacterium MD308]|nr:hypothetical protein [Lachnospiraceae bacterium MD308]MCI8580412.1 hypothetical protein [Dorea sp.]